MSADIAIKCDMLEMMVAEFEARISALPTFGYEAPEEALNLMKPASRHVIGVVTLARADFNLLVATRSGPTGKPTALSCWFEIG